MFDPEIPSRYIEAHYEPSDRLAVVLINRQTGTVKHEFGSAEFLASPRYQAHLRAVNAHGADVYLTVNTLNPDAKRGTKTDVAAIRHLYLDIDEGGPAALGRLLLDRDMPKPHSVLESSPGKYQVLWQVENFSPEHAETVVRGLARRFGADASVWDTARVLRLPGFRNHKYETPHYVVEGPNSAPPYRLRPLDFPAFPESEPQAAEPRDLAPDHHSGSHHSQSERDWAFANRSLVRDRIGHIRLRNFHTRDGQHYFDKLAEDMPHLSHQSLLRVKALLSSAFTFAKQEDAIRGVNPTQGIKVEGRRYKPARHAYALEDIQAMLLKLPEPARTIVMVAALSGLRLSEIRGLRWEDYTGTELNVSRSVWRTHVGPTKTEESGASPVPVIPILRTALDEHRKRCTGRGFIFAGERRGTPLHLDNLARRVIVPALGDHWHGWHAFRRGLGTNLHRLGVAPKVIQEILRHADVSTTEAHYIIIDRSETAKAMKRLEKAVGKKWAKIQEPAVGF